MISVQRGRGRGNSATYLARQGQAYPSSDLVRVVDEQMTDVPQDGQVMAR